MEPILEELKNRILARVERVPSGCWEWQRACGSHGYGQIMFKMKLLLVHRASYEVHHGPIPKGLFVLHKCDNRRCVNPEHLFLGTAKDNMKDMILKGRDQLDNCLKLSDEQVIEIRKLLKGCTYNQYDIATLFNVSQATVSRINTATSYDWV